MRFKNLVCTFLLLLLSGFGMNQAMAKSVEGVVNINTASASELTLLPGIGKAKAEQIIQLRQAKPFSSVDDLKAVTGLGAKRLEAMRPHVVVDGATTAKKVVTPKAETQPSATSATPKI